MVPTWTRYVLIGLIAVALLTSVPALARGAPNPTTSSAAMAVGTPAGVHPALAPNPFASGMPASLVLGAPNFTTLWNPFPPNASAGGGDPEWAVPDAHGNLWTTDFSDSRVLEYPAPFTNGEPASVVIGQSNFTGHLGGTTSVNLTNPAATAFDAAGDLWVSDYRNDRVLEYVPPFHSGMAASLVLGQTSMTTSTAAAGATGLSGPTGLSFDSQGDLWVADSYNNRVLEYVPPFSTGMAASVVLGQSNFSGVLSGLSATNLSYPLQAAFATGMVWVADLQNARVVGYPVPASSGEAATVVLGQPNLISGTATGPNAFSEPTGVMADPSGHLWVTDQGKNRVVEFAPNPPTNATPIAVIGQTNLSGTAPALTATGLNTPIGVYATGNALWVTDAGNDRILEYLPENFSVQVSASGLPAGTQWAVTFDNTSANGTTSAPLTFSRMNGTYLLSVTPVAGYQADPSFSTVVVNGSTVTVTIRFAPTAPDPFSSGMPATVVLGQPNFWTGTGPTGPGANSTHFRDPGYAAAFDAHGNLWVADWGANRVLEFVPPFTSGMAASLVLGQSSMSGYLAGTSATNLSEPDGLAFDAAGNLWVSEYGNNRVVEFPAPFSNGEAAVAVIGQPGFGPNTGASGPGNLSGPSGIAIENGTLWVTDYNNNRIVAFPAPLTTGEAATIVLGQDSLTGSHSGLTATNLSRPSWIAFDAQGNAWVADDGNNRALEFLAPFVTNESASVVLGQQNFTTSSTPSSTSLFDDNALSIDAHGNIWVADSGDNRVLEYAGPTFVTNQSPVRVIGQGNFSTYASGLGPSGLNYPTLPLTDSHGNLWVIDESNYRVLGYIPAEYRVTFQSVGTASPASWNLTVNGVTQTVTGASASVLSTNSTVNWSAAAPGWSLPAYSGRVVVNGAPAVVDLSFTRVVYVVTFTENGLPSGKNWSVAIGSVTHSSTSPTITFSEPNGTYSFAIGNVSGYRAVNQTGQVVLNGGAQSVAVAFHAKSSGGGGTPISLWIGLGVGIVVVAALVAFLLMRRRKRGPTPATAWTPPPGVAPGPTPPAPTGAPPPPAEPSAPQAPPPGASG